MRKIGIISDTHDLLREEVLEVLQGCELILHAGDMNRPDILEALEGITEVFAVRGNNDEGFKTPLPETLRFSYAGLKFYMIHDRKQLAEDVSDRDIIVYGHSHIYEEKQENGQLWLNPGSCGPKRFFMPLTMAVLEAEDTGDYRVRKMELSAHTASGGHNGFKEELSRVNKLTVVRAVMKAADKGKSLSGIAAKYGISKELAEHICRLYVTHPGITAEEIINKLDLYKM